MGNVAAHEIVAPKPTELVAALDIAETLLKTIYVLPEVAEIMKPKPSSRMSNPSIERSAKSCNSKWGKAIVIQYYQGIGSLMVRVK